MGFRKGTADNFPPLNRQSAKKRNIVTLENVNHNHIQIRGCANGCRSSRKGSLIVLWFIAVFIRVPLSFSPLSKRGHVFFCDNSCCFLVLGVLSFFLCLKKLRKSMKNDENLGENYWKRN